MILEPIQGEGGYIFGKKEWLLSVQKECNDLGISLIADEIQTFARTGKTFAFENFNIQPDIIAISKSSVLGITMASLKYEEAMNLGWHSCTWGGGKVLDNNIAWTTLDTYLNYKDETFLGLTYRENQINKGEYIQAAFEWLKESHPEILKDFAGMGCLWRFDVANRDTVVQTAKKYGLKLLTVGVTKNVSPIRAIFLADVLTKEINSFIEILNTVFTELKR